MYAHDITGRRQQANNGCLEMLKPFMKEVVRNEVLKWLDGGVIYPISDSS